MPILSVIIPVYNVESFLDECLASVVNQTLKDIEIICVNDGSTDHSLDILQKWAQRDNRINVLTQENKKLSAARNKGLKIAKGKYVAFVDPDDYISNCMYEKLLLLMETRQLDIVGCAYTTVPDNQKHDYTLATNIQSDFSTLLKTTEILQSSNDLCFCWRYMIKKEVLTKNNLIFNEKVKVGEDMIFMIDVFAHSKDIYLTNQSLYYYRVNNPNSIMRNSTFNPNLESSLSLMWNIKMKQIKKYNIDKYTPYTKDLAGYAIKTYMPMFFRNINIEQTNVSRLQRIHHILSMPMVREAMQIIGFRNIYTSWKEYVFYIMMKIKFCRLVEKLYFRE